MNYSEFVEKLDPQTISKLSVAVETGRWDNGEHLSEKQREDAMSAVMLWNAKFGGDGNNEPYKVNKDGEFKIGKGALTKEVPLEYRDSNDETIEIKIHK